jgi:hypothetical protein
MDKVMQWLGIEVANHNGKNAIHVVHCTTNGKPYGGGRNSWVNAFQGYALKLNPIIDDIHK